MEDFDGVIFGISAGSMNSAEEVYAQPELDGERLFKDITYPDSMGHTFIAIPDGSYLYSEDGKEKLMGEHFVISDGGIV